MEQEHRACSDKLEALVREMDSMMGEEAVQYLLPRVHLVKGKPSIEIPLMTEKYDIDLHCYGNCWSNWNTWSNHWKYSRIHYGASEMLCIGD